MARKFKGFAHFERPVGVSSVADVIKEYIIDLSEQAGTMTKIANALNKDKSNLSRFVNDRTCTNALNDQDLTTLAEGLGISIPDLLGGLHRVSIAQEDRLKRKLETHEKRSQSDRTTTPKEK